LLVSCREAAFTSQVLTAHPKQTVAGKFCLQLAVEQLSDLRSRLLAQSELLLMFSLAETIQDVLRILIATAANIAPAHRPFNKPCKRGTWKKKREVNINICHSY
jgi:hypothetical protein